MQAFTTYKQALNYIYSHTNFERKQMPKYNLTTLDLSRIQGLLGKLDNPQEKFRVVLIAGTKGKGSTSSMCESILRAGAYKTGLYSSPHLHSFRERIRVDGKAVSEERVVSLVNQVRPFADKIVGLTAWEIMTAMAFLRFAEAESDVAVLEVGLGGRLDATNVTNPLVSVITSISYDHTHLLGNTLTKIAGEKAGIIKPGGLVVSAPQYAEAMTVIEDICAEKEAQLQVIGDKNSWRIGRISLKSQTVYVDGEAYQVPLLGQHQAVNAVTALRTVQALQQTADLTISVDAYKAGLASVRCPGRLEVLSRSPFLIVDSAMNGDSAWKLQQTLSSYFPGRQLILVFGASVDHDYAAMFNRLLPYAKRTIAIQANHPRATRPDVLTATAQALGYQIDSAPNIPQALDTALKAAEERELICVTGSLFCAAEARLAWMQQEGMPLPETDPI